MGKLARSVQTERAAIITPASAIAAAGAKSPMSTDSYLARAAVQVAAVPTTAGLPAMVWAMAAVGVEAMAEKTESYPQACGCKAAETSKCGGHS